VQPTTSDDEVCMGAPSMLRFPYAAYSTAARLEDQRVAA
jgi:hypothetical protein